ncbi:glycosyltransferase family 2 protein [Sinisalibacter aestuarii]|uniref:Glycosyl transferase n=1 Tax=Sinisalibacter aestuarii TaxID=2949426 RepID=A0ABQ5LUG3_9RHOB|nr:glycosyltransferase family 2 protein [Sinisalibacter aestuarii]GKY88625.1 glycosyl transferase [Sinisalibacter aestuarii]
MADGRVAILLAIYNGAGFLAEQLDSLAAQSHDDWVLVVSCDGSTDGSRAVVERFAAAHPGRVAAIVEGPRRGFAQNFLALLDRVPEDAGFIAFCDQDDVWLPQKLARQIARLAREPAAAMVAGRTILCDAGLAEIGRSPLFARPPGFANALVQNIGGGNTMMFNRAALVRLRRAAPHAGGIVAHDWWAYQVLAGTGAAVIYDPEPLVLYRQHGANQIGQNATARARARRLGQLLGGRFRGWSNRSLASLAPIRADLTAENRALLDAFAAQRQRGLAGRVRGIGRLGLYRQTRPGQIALHVGFALGLI